MNQSEFLEQIERVDKQFAEERMPIHARSLHAFGLLAPDYEGPVNVGIAFYHGKIAPNVVGVLSS